MRAGSDFGVREFVSDFYTKKARQKSGDKSPHCKSSRLGFGLFPRVVRRASERTRLNMFETHLEPEVTPAIEFCGSDVALDR